MKDSENISIASVSLENDLSIDDTDSAPQNKGEVTNNQLDSDSCEEVQYNPSTNKELSIVTSDVQFIARTEVEKDHAIKSQGLELVEKKKPSDVTNDTVKVDTPTKVLMSDSCSKDGAADIIDVIENGSKSYTFDQSKKSITPLELEYKRCIIDVSISFGLLTRKSEAPPIGAFQTPLNCRMLDNLIHRMENLAEQSLSPIVDKENTSNAKKRPIFLTV